MKSKTRALSLVLFFSSGALFAEMRFPKLEDPHQILPTIEGLTAEVPFEKAFLCHRHDVSITRDEKTCVQQDCTTQRFKDFIVDCGESYVRIARYWFGGTKNQAHFYARARYEAARGNSFIDHLNFVHTRPDLISIQLLAYRHTTFTLENGTPITGIEFQFEVAWAGKRNSIVETWMISPDVPFLAQVLKRSVIDRNPEKSVEIKTLRISW